MSNPGGIVDSDRGLSACIQLCQKTSITMDWMWLLINSELYSDASEPQFLT